VCGYVAQVVQYIPSKKQGPEFKLSTTQKKKKKKRKETQLKVLPVGFQDGS
jgi:hypothetical protein